LYPAQGKMASSPPCFSNRSPTRREDDALTMKS
jgi:hypothetical protein